MVALHRLVYERKRPPPHPSWILAWEYRSTSSSCLIVWQSFGQNRRPPTPLANRVSMTDLCCFCIIIGAAQHIVVIETWRWNELMTSLIPYSYGRETNLHPVLTTWARLQPTFTKSALLWLASFGLESKTRIVDPIERLIYVHPCRSFQDYARVSCSSILATVPSAWPSIWAIRLVLTLGHCWPPNPYCFVNHYSSS